MCSILKIKLSRYWINRALISFTFLYPLLALDRIKKIFSFKIEGFSTTNEIWIIPLVCLLLYLFGKTTENKKNLFFLLCLYAYMLIIVIGGFNVVSIQQYVYAVLLFIVPTLLFFALSNISKDTIGFLLKLFVFTCLAYSVFAIILTINYAYFMSLVGNPVDYRYYNQYRASMMLGSSIAVSYYFNLTLPFCFYVFFNSNKRKWKMIASLAIAANIMATFLLLSRAAFLCTIMISLFYLLYMKGGKYGLRKKAAFIFIAILVIVYSILNYDLSRLMNLNLKEDSVALRFSSGELGLYIFTKYPLFGSGMARHFHRVYMNRYLNINGLSGLIDPHNMYILIMSELGIIGFLITIILFIGLFKRFSKIRDKSLRQTAHIMLFAFLFDAMGGSHLFNEISYATIFWIYMGLLNSIAIKDLNESKHFYVNNSNNELSVKEGINLNVET